MIHMLWQIPLLKTYAKDMIKNTDKGLHTAFFCTSEKNEKWSKYSAMNDKYTIG